MEQYFATISETMEGYGEFEAEALALKVRVYQPLTENGRRAHGVFFSSTNDCASGTSGMVNTSDIARLMEMFQVCSPSLRMNFSLTLRFPEFPSQV